MKASLRWLQDLLDLCLLSLPASEKPVIDVQRGLLQDSLLYPFWKAPRRRLADLLFSGFVSG